jgi:hypothetical protein
MRTNKQTVWLDYGRVGTKKLLENLSGATVVGDHLWTVSDEGRTIECLRAHRGGYAIVAQVRLDDVFARMPGRQKGDEADLEAVASDGSKLWVCGSHCRVRRQVAKTGSKTVDPRIRTRKSRRLLGRVSLTPTGDGIRGAGHALPFSGNGSLHGFLSSNPLIAPFIHLPSKENGLDIEGLAVRRSRLFIGLRGPLVDSMALVVEVTIRQGLVLVRHGSLLHVLDLGGLGIRDIASLERGFAVLAGPVSGANGPFRLFHWQPRRRNTIQRPQLQLEWPISKEHPEGICPMNRHGRAGLMILYDSPGKERVEGSRYRADWVAFAK